ncbi:hypothetical protein [Vibrio marinisediminis]|nr:hypothetical protein [Vibrio marinisediminis]
MYILVIIIRILAGVNCMSKRLCKWNRQDIAEQLGDIQRLVSAPQYFCRSCARAAQDKDLLCKPMSLDPIRSVDLLVEQQDANEKAVVNASASETPSMSHASKMLPTQPDAKQAKKQAKKQKKYIKQLKKTVNKQQKLLKKQRKLELQFNKVNLSFSQLNIETHSAYNQDALH